MINVAPKIPFTAADYLALDVDQPERHYFVDGEVYAVSGGENLMIDIPARRVELYRKGADGCGCCMPRR